MATSECINDEDKATNSIEGVTSAQGDPLLRLEHAPQNCQGDPVSVKDTFINGDIYLSPGMNAVDACSPKRQVRTECKLGALKLPVPATYDTNVKPDVPPASHRGSPSFEIHDTVSTLGSPIHQNILIPQHSESPRITSAESTNELYGVERILSPASIDDTSHRVGRKCILKNVIVEYVALPHRPDDELTLNIMRDDGLDQLRLTRISTTKWNASENIECDTDNGDITMVAHSKKRGDVGFLGLTTDEIHAMSYAEEDTPVRHLFVSVAEGNWHVDIKIFATIVSNFTHIPSGISMTETQQTVNAFHEALRNSREFLRRFADTGNIEDINQVILYGERIASMSSFLVLRGMFGLLSALGSAYSIRFDITGNHQDICRAISYYQEALDSAPAGQAYILDLFNALGRSYSSRFAKTNNLEDLDHAISHQQRAVESTPSNHIAYLSGLLNNLGNSYSSRFNRTGNLADNDYAMSCYQRLVDSTPPGHPCPSHLFDSLGICYSNRFVHTGNLDDIECAICYHQKAVGSTPSGHPGLSAQLNNLGISYLIRFERTGNLEDMNYAIFHLQKAIQCTPSDHSGLPTMFNNLGNAYARCFIRTGNLENIECAICYNQKAVDSTPSDHHGLSIFLNGLGTSYSHRFQSTHNLEDIDYAISYLKKALKLTPHGHAQLPNLFSNLGVTHAMRFDCTGNLEDIDYAISHLQKAIHSTQPGQANHPGWLSNLGTSYARRFQRTGNLEDIGCAIRYHQEAMDSTPSGHADRPLNLQNLGNSYRLQFKRTGNLKDIDYSISYQQKAVDSTPSDHIFYSNLFSNLGNSYADRFKCSSNDLDAQHSITSYRRGAQSNGSPSARLSSAKNAAIHSVLRDKSRCLLDFSLAIGILSEVGGLEQTIHRRYDNLHGHSDFVGIAVAVAFIYNRPDFALEWLEQGRCLVWNQLHQLRTPIDDLRIRNQSLADQFVLAASALESYGGRSINSMRTSYATLTDEIRLQSDVQKHTLYAIQYNKLLEEIRALPDFKDFLRPPKMTTILSSLPTDGPIIVFNIHELRCDALALISGIEDPLLIPLDNFSFDKAKQLLKTFRSDILKNREADDQDRKLPQRVNNVPASMSHVLKELWCNVVEPVLEALGYFIDISGHRRRIWWCPSGPLAFLPLHAAGIYGSEYKPGSCISDYAVSSYTPTVQSLNEKFSASSAAPRRNTNILLVNPNTPGLRPIPFTATETHDIKELFGESALLLEDAAASMDTVKKELGTHNWAHFACHGIQDLQDPLKSGVHLFDGRLELLNIMHQKLLNADFAFLSACQTSKGDAKLPEEVVHIAAGMLAAGYHGVVGTMWSISDRHGPQFAKYFYDYLFKEKISEGLDSTKAAYALDYATRKVRETLGDGDNAFLTWVPYVHFGY